MADNEELIQAAGRRIESSTVRIGHRCTAETRRIRIVEIVFVIEVVEREIARAIRVPIDAPGRLLIVNRQCFGGRLEVVRSNSGGWNVLEHLGRRNGECRLRNYVSGEDAGEWLARCNLVAQKVRESLSQIGTFDFASKGWGIGKVASPIGQRRHSDYSRILSLLGVLPLIVGKEEELVAFDGPTQSPAILILPEYRALSRKIVFCIEIRIAQELKTRAMKGIAAGLGHNVDQSTAIVSVLRVGIAGQDAKLRDGIEVWNNSGLLPNTFLNIRPIDGKPVGVLTLTVDRKLTGIGGPGDRNGPKAAARGAVPCTARCQGCDADLCGEQVGITPAI